MQADLLGYLFNVIPIQSFTRGIQYIMAVDQNPLFWNYTYAKAQRLLELQAIKRGYAHLNVPDTGSLTEGPGQCSCNEEENQARSETPSSSRIWL